VAGVLPNASIRNRDSIPPRGALWRIVFYSKPPAALVFLCFLLKKVTRHGGASERAI